MNRGLRIALIVVFSIALLLAIAILFISTFNWNHAKPWVVQKISNATHRPFAINGDLSMKWEPPVQKQRTWLGWIPWPHLRAGGVVLGNPGWATTGPDMARVKQVDFSIDLLPLLHKTLRVPSLVLTEPYLILEQDKSAHNNWTFSEEKQKNPSEWKTDFGNLGITQGVVRYVDPVKKADATAQIATFKDGSINWKLDGKFNDEKLEGEGQAGALLSLQSAKTRYPVKAVVKVGETTITADGTLTNPEHLSALDINLKILGASMADLFALSGVVLPTTPKFSTEGRVIGTIAPGSVDLKYQDFQGKVGSSDIEGTLEYVEKKPRPLLQGKVHSDYLNFTDLAPIIGAGKHPEKEKEEEKVAPGKVLPVSPFKTDRWRTMDVDVEFAGKQIIHSKKLPLDDLFTRIRLDDGTLSLAPLNFGVAGGKLVTELRIDGKADPAKAKMKIDARGVKLSELLPEVKSMRASVGQIRADAALSASGNSIAALLGSSNGEVKALINHGRISKFILEAIGLNIGSVVATKLFGDKEVPLNCMATDFNVDDGVMKAQTFIIDTDDAKITVDGKVDFSKENLDLTIHPQSKGIRLFSLRSPLYVAGTFKKPDVGVNKGVVALKAGAAATLGAVAAPAAGLLALINPGPDEDSPCGKLLAEAKEKPKAPPPSKSDKSEKSEKSK